MIAAIHQPNFFPWLGYFNKIARCDVFVVLDDAQYQKTGSSWSNRVRLLISGEARWVTAPVVRPAHGAAAIRELVWASQPWREKLLRQLELNYRRAPCFEEAMQVLAPLIGSPEPHVSAYNLHAITTLKTLLELPARVVLASDFDLATTANERLIQLVERVGCDTYLAGGGAEGYQDDSQFEAAGLKVKSQAFVHPCYPQHGSREFVTGLSIVDALMNCGIARTRELVRS